MFIEVSGLPISPIFSSLKQLFFLRTAEFFLRMLADVSGQITCPETSANNYQHTQRKKLDVHGRTTYQTDLTTSLQPRHIPTQDYNITQSSAPDDGCPKHVEQLLEEK